MKREIVRVEPLPIYLERWKPPTSAVTRHGDTIHVSGFPPFDPNTGQIAVASIERQTEIVLEQLKLCLDTTGSSLEQVSKCNVHCTSVDKFAVVNEVYAHYFPKDPLLGLGHSTSSSTASRPLSLEVEDNVLGHIRGSSE